MSEKPPAANPDELPPARSELETTDAGRPERVGPLTVETITKDDGRRLRAYWHRDPER
jgi:hypothetical protein